MLIWTIIAAAIVVLDQLSKYLVVTKIDPVEAIRVIPGLFDFVYVKNTGAAFSMLSNSTVILGVFSVIFCFGVIAYWYFTKPTHPLLKTSLTFLFAGALGNAIDRVLNGYVIDFISTSFMNFPVFNVADIAITVGAVLLIVHTIFFDKDEKGKDEKNGETDSSDIKSE